MQFKPRDYQTELVGETWESLIRDKNTRPCIYAPTGAGKSWLIAMIASLVQKNPSQGRRSGKTLVLAHRTELVVQNAQKDVGVYTTIYSAGAGEKNFNGDCVIAARDSLVRNYKKKLENCHFDVVLIDEAHRVNNKKNGGYRRMFEYLLSKNPNTRFIGLTASPFRLTGQINQSIISTGKKEDDRFFTRLINKVSTKELIVQGYLSPLISYADKKSIDTSRLKLDSTGDFEVTEAGHKYVPLIRQHIETMLGQVKERKQVIIFCCSVEHCNYVSQELKNRGHDSALITSGTPPIIRKCSINDFKKGRIKYLIGCNIFTEGFDAPAIDAVILFRPTKSAALYLQIIGRGLRVAEGKKNCLILDYGGNVQRHGRIDEIKVTKEAIVKTNREADPKVCPECDFINLSNAKICEECGVKLSEEIEREVIQSDVARTFSLDEIIASDEEAFKELQINYVKFSRHRKKGADGSIPSHFTLKVEYFLEKPGIFQTGKALKTEWLCLNHKGFALSKALIALKKELNLTPSFRSVEQTLIALKKGDIELILPTLVKTKEDEENGFSRIKFIEILESKKVSSQDENVIVEVEKEVLDKYVSEEDKKEEKVLNWLNDVELDEPEDEDMPDWYF